MNKTQTSDASVSKELKDRLEWFYQARYGVMAHFVPNVARFRPESRIEWTSETWSQWVDNVDVEKVADQVAEIGAGYFVISTGQMGKYHCTPNPVYEKLWGLRPYEYGSRRDLPHDLAQALKKRNIRMMLYITAHPHDVSNGAAEHTAAAEKIGWYRTEKYKSPTGVWKYGLEATREATDKWIEAVKWWIEHYRGICSGYWIDGLKDFDCDGYPARLVGMIRKTDPDAILSNVYDNSLSDFYHGHAHVNWDVQQTRLPTQGRWMPEENIQWHAFQYLGRVWGNSMVAHEPVSIVDYAHKVISGGGVITFDYGTFDENCIPYTGPYLEIPEVHMEQLRAVRDNVKDIDR